MLDLGANLGLGLLDFADRLVQNTAFSVLFVSAAAGGNLPNDLAPSVFFALLDPGVTCVGADYVFLAVQQFGNLRDVCHIGRCYYHAVHQA
ncbi:Translation elongation factor EF-G [Pseudomonas syringae pv. actinidiae]|uniref:Translation elongation factor EF-G n=1 Tax=Pseudomonas syringae pv. actinidiae TaxID=103796 RepID=A0AAN4TPW3_PSESF|nr:Translation elongation factor EF-G [Pseudomonas syringae pv. actinidiae]